MLPVELAVRVEPGAGSTFGSGILIGQYHVLTCAHVIDPDYSRADYADPDADPGALVNINDRPLNNAELRSRMAGRFVEVTAYDGINRKASLVAVHQHQDLVLLRLSEPVRHAVRLPELQTDYDATKASTATGLGFRRTQLNAYSLRSQSLTLTSSDSATFKSRSETLDGQASEGMSGGPVMMEFSGSRLKIIAMLTMGGSTQATCGVIRADTLRAFMETHLGKDAFAPQADAAHGLAPAFRTLPGKAQTAVRWLPLPKAKRDDNGYGYDRMRFIASRPLTFADIDAVSGYPVREQNRLNRESFFAPMTIDEAHGIVRLLTEKLGETFSIPDRRAQDGIKPPSDIPACKNGPHQAADQIRPELVIAPECDGRRCFERDGAVFPAGGAPEWIVDDGAVRLAFADPPRSVWEIAALPGTLAQKRYKALLRPVLTIPIWMAAQ